MLCGYLPSAIHGIDESVVMDECIQDICQTPYQFK
jgi:hypothetical protein